MEAIEAVDRLVDEREAARILCVSPGTLSVWRSTRRWPLPYAKLGKAIRYSTAALEKFVAERTVVPERPPKAKPARKPRRQRAARGNRPREAANAAAK